MRLNLLNIAVILSGIIPGRLYIFKMLVKDCNADDRKAGNCGYRCDCNSDPFFALLVIIVPRYALPLGKNPFPVAEHRDDAGGGDAIADIRPRPLLVRRTVRVHVLGRSDDNALCPSGFPAAVYLRDVGGADVKGAERFRFSAIDHGDRLGIPPAGEARAECVVWRFAVIARRVFLGDFLHAQPLSKKVHFGRHRTVRKGCGIPAERYMTPRGKVEILLIPVRDARTEAIQNQVDSAPDP